MLQIEYITGMNVNEYFFHACRLEAKKKRRRWVILFALAGLLCVGAGTYMMWPSTENAALPIEKPIAAQAIPTPTEDIVSIKTNESDSAHFAIEPASNVQPARPSNYSPKTSNRNLNKKTKTQASLTQKAELPQKNESILSLNKQTLKKATVKKGLAELHYLNQLPADGLWGKKDINRGLQVPLDFRNHYWHFYAETGATANLDFASPGERSWQYASYFEVGVSRNVSRNLRLGIGIGYMSFAGIRRTASREELSYNFVASQRTEILHHDQSQWLSLPVSLEYRLMKGVGIIGGARISYLTQTQGILETIEQNAFGLKSSSQAPVNQYMDGLRRMNYQLQVGLSFRPSARLELRGMLIRGVRSVTDAAVLNGGGNDKSSHVQLGLRWYVW